MVHQAVKPSARASKHIAPDGQPQPAKPILTAPKIMARKYIKK
jgi:hypothetical protein